MCSHRPLEKLKWWPPYRVWTSPFPLTVSWRWSAMSICEATDRTSAEYYSTLRMSPRSYCQASAAGPAGIAGFCKMWLNLRASGTGMSSRPKPPPGQELPPSSHCTLRPGPCLLRNMPPLHQSPNRMLCFRQRHADIAASPPVPSWCVAVHGGCCTSGRGMEWPVPDRGILCCPSTSDVRPQFPQRPPCLQEPRLEVLG